MHESVNQGRSEEKGVLWILPVPWFTRPTPCILDSKGAVSQGKPSHTRRPESPDPLTRIVWNPASPDPPTLPHPRSSDTGYESTPCIQCPGMPGCSAPSRHGSRGPPGRAALAPWQLAGRRGQGSGGAPSTRPGQCSFSEGPQPMKFFSQLIPQSLIFSSPLPNP